MFFNRLLHNCAQSLTELLEKSHFYSHTHFNELLLCNYSIIHFAAQENQHNNDLTQHCSN